MTCDEVRDQLAEHLLGTLDEVTDAGVRAHLRSCGACRREAAALAEGISTFSRAAHEVEPPPDLRDRVLGVLADEWADSTARRRRSFVTRERLASLAAVAALIVSLVWGVSQARLADRYEVAAGKYGAFLKALGGKNVRVGQIHGTGAQQVDGSAVVYESDVEQSWVLVLVRAPGLSGRATVTLGSPAGRTIDMHPLEFAEGGESSSWLVTSADLRPFDTVTITGSSGAVIATATVSSD